MSPITTWIFPGQGSQAVGMCREAFAASAAARAVLAEAEEALGEKIGAKCPRCICVAEGEQKIGNSAEEGALVEGDLAGIDRLAVDRVWL